MGGLFTPTPKGVVTKYGENLATNGVILSADEKTLYVTNGPSLVAFDVQGDGSLANQRAFARLDGGGNGDGSTIDAAGRIYVTSNPGVQIISRRGDVSRHHPDAATSHQRGVWRPGQEDTVRARPRRHGRERHPGRQRRAGLRDRHDRAGL